MSDPLWLYVYKEKKVASQHIHNFMLHVKTATCFGCDIYSHHQAEFRTLNKKRL